MISHERENTANAVMFQAGTADHRRLWYRRVSRECVLELHTFGARTVTQPILGTYRSYFYS
jgi:hypothetical protein